MIDMFDFEFDCYECRECTEIGKKNNVESPKCSCLAYKKISFCVLAVGAVLAALLLERLCAMIDGGPEL
jgi:hypothetical protein